MTIDLDSAPPPSARARPRPVSRRALALVVGIAVLLGLGASVPAPPAVRQVLVAESSSAVFAITEEALFTADPLLGTGYFSVVRHGITDRSVSWSVRLPHRVDDLRATGAGVLFAATGDGTAVSILDSATGDPRWRDTRGPSWVLRTDAGGALLTSENDGTPVVRLVDLRTGRERWTRPWDPAGFVHPGDPVVTQDRDGRIRVYALADGAELGALDLPSDRFGANRVDDRVYVAGPAGDAESLTAFQLPDFRQVWQRAPVPPGVPSGCGRELCLDTDRGMVVLDAADGELRWAASEWRWGYDARTAGLPGSSRLVVTDGGPPEQLLLVDPGTGRTLSRLGGSTVLGDIVLHPDSERVGWTWVQRAAGDDSIRTLGDLTMISPPRCAAAGDYLACPTTIGQTGVWRLPR